MLSPPPQGRGPWFTMGGETPSSTQSCKSPPWQHRDRGGGREAVAQASEDKGKHRSRHGCRVWRQRHNPNSESPKLLWPLTLPYLDFC